MCYRDRWFCSAACETTACVRRWTKAEAAAARQWWGKDGAPVDFHNHSDKCAAYQPPPGGSPGATLPPGAAN